MNFWTVREQDLIEGNILIFQRILK